MWKGKVDVMVNTYNSEKYLDACLKSIVKNVPVNTLWVIDKFSKDKTKTIALKYGAKVIESDCSLAEARALGFSLVSTPLFVNVDSDVVLCEDWFNKLIKHWDSLDIGALSGVQIDQEPLHKAYMETMYKIRPSVSYDIPKLPNMIARKDFLENIKFSKAVKSGSIANEDFEIKFWLEKLGYRWKIAPVFSKHFTYPSPLNTKTFWQGASIRLTKAIPFKSVFIRFALSVPQAIFVAIVSRNARLIPYWIKFRYQVIYGYLNWKKFYNLQR